MTVTTSGQILVSSDGTEIWAESVGDRSKPSVVFIHGFACTAVVFDKQFSDQTLLKNLHLVRYEARGHGRSGYPEEPAAYESARYADDFKTVCDAFGVVKPFVLGWSLGGGIIVDIIEAFGANFISGAIYCGGAVLTRELHTTYMQPMLEKLVPDLLSTDSNVISRASLQFVQSCVENPHAALPFETKIQWLGGCAMLPQNVRLLTLSRQQSTDRWEKEIKQLPVLIVHGTMDSMVITSKLQETASRYLQNYQIKLLDDVGHAPFYERPAETNYHILDFVSGRK